MLKKIVMMILFGMSSITVHASSDRTRNTILPIAIPVRQVPSQDIISLATNPPILPIQVMATPVNSNLHGLRVILSQPSHRVVPVVAPDIENGRNQNEVEVDRNQQELIDDQEAWRDILTCNLSPNEGYYLLIGTTLTLGFFAAVGSVIAETSQ